MENITSKEKTERLPIELIHEGKDALLGALLLEHGKRMGSVEKDSMLLFRHALRKYWLLVRCIWSNYLEEPYCTCHVDITWRK